MTNSANLFTPMKLNPIAPVFPAESDRLERLIEQRQRGEINEQFFLKARLQQGIYGMRGLTDTHMVRVRVPLGRLNGFQLERLGRVAERYGDGRGHTPERQPATWFAV